MSDNNIYNKKGFTLLELLIAISIFGIISVMTFSIINFVPKLAKTESNQYSERAYVRRAAAEITNVIQSSSMAPASLVFTMPSGEKISYEYNGGNVNKIVDGTPYRLMESVAEFEITAEEDHLFNIHIKTSKEGKDYDFKVEGRKDGSTKTDAVISSISPTSVVFDKNNPRDISITLNLNGNDLNNLWNDLNKLIPGTDYSISGSELTLKESYLKSQFGIINIRFNVSNGVDPVLLVEIKDTSTQIKIEGNSYEDDLVRMDYPGNLKIDPLDDQWILTITNATLTGGIDKDDLAITGLPSGINVTAAKVENENKIIITLLGMSSAPVTTTKSVEIIILGSAVGTSASNSDPIKVFLLPGATFASPEHNLLFTNEVQFDNNVKITGDVVIGRGAALTTIETQCEFYGTVYIDSSLYVKNNITVGKSGKPGRLFVKGSAEFGTHSTINGDLFYRDELNAQNGLTVTGRKEQTAVEIPGINIPKLKQPEEWYANNGYIVKNNTSMELKELESNKKYFFTNSVELRNDSKPLDNITIVGKGKIEFGSKFTGSGIIFAPDGEVYFKNGCNFTGMCVSKKTVLKTDCILKFQRYPELPFDYNY